MFVALTSLEPSLLFRCTHMCGQVIQAMPEGPALTEANIDEVNT